MAVTVRRDWKRLTMTPASNSAAIDPAAIVRSTSPSSAEDRCRPSRTWGIRAAQLAAAKPQPMNATYVARVAAGSWT
jgi:hypothetical protein